uniref:replication restart helicase PriA n=1 Tax=Candidatus Cryptobacteroides bacterium TaxID=3085639 RepID=UPI004028EA75
MTGRIFIQVILPLRLEWEPFYYQEIELSESAGDASGLFPVTSTGSVTERDKEQVRVGDRVRVNFAGKEYVGVVSDVDSGEKAEALGITNRVKPIIGEAEGLEPVTKEEIELWRQIAEYYLCTVGEVYKAAYPAQKVEKEVVQARQEALKVEREEKNRTKIADKIKRLEERAEKKAELAAKARKSESRERYLAEKEMLEGEIGLLVRELTSMVGEHCRTTGSVTGYGDSVTYHQDEEPIGGSIIETSEGTEKEISLSAAQEEAYSKIKEIFAKGKPALLHGVTGSGKTEIYLKLAQETLAMGKNVLYLVPEIALSRQLEDRISETFPELLVFHSGETMSRKREVATVLRHAGEPAEGKGYVVLGTRSAIFLPHKNLGLVIVDEEHDTSYKQDSPAPRYNGRETAIMMAKIFGANVILGSATPSLESLYNCSVGRYGLVTLNKRFYDAADSDIEIIDTIAERRKNGMIGNFSRKLIEHIGKCLGEHRQVLILRERRAYSPIVQCQECGDIPKCRCCNVSLSLHRRADGSERLVCHYCGRVYEYTGKCHKCGGVLKPLGSGTQKIEEEASKLFPNARIARLDSDTAQSRKYETDTIRKFSNGEIDILIGTRMVAKGFDFSGLSLVAVLQADSILGQEDYRADERGLQLLEQFRGRCGRRGEKGLFVIQTSQPEHPVYQSIDGKLDENGTMARFLGERKLFGYPPYSRVIGVVIKDYNQARVDLLSRDLGEYLRGALAVKVSIAPGVQNGPNVIGPYSPAIDKISNQNIRQIRVLLPKDRSLARNKETLAAAVERFEKEKKYSGHIALDVDPA